MFKVDPTIENAKLYPRPPVVELVYWITAKAPDFPIKIGRTNTRSIRQRFSHIQTALPYELEALLVMEGGRELEREVHDGFWSDHLRGEWFKRTPDMLETIEFVGAADAGWRRWLPSTLITE